MVLLVLSTLVKWHPSDWDAVCPWPHGTLWVSPSCPCLVPNRTWPQVPVTAPIQFSACGLGLIQGLLCWGALAVGGQWCLPSSVFGWSRSSSHRHFCSIFSLQKLSLVDIIVPPKTLLTYIVMLVIISHQQAAVPSELRGIKCLMQHCSPQQLRSCPWPMALLSVLLWTDVILWSHLSFVHWFWNNDVFLLAYLGEKNKRKY